LDAGDAGVARLLHVVGVEVLEHGARQRDRQRDLRERGECPRREHGLGIQSRRHVVVGREGQPGARQLGVVEVHVDVTGAGIDVMGGREAGRQPGAFPLVAFRHRIRPEEAHLVHVDAEHEPLARVEAVEGEGQPRAAVGHGEVDRVDSVAADDLQRPGVVGPRAARGRVEQAVADGQAVAQLVGLDRQLDELCARRAAGPGDLDQVAALVFLRGVFVVNRADLDRCGRGREEPAGLDLLEAADPRTAGGARSCLNRPPSALPEAAKRAESIQ